VGVGVCVCVCVVVGSHAHTKSLMHTMCVRYWELVGATKRDLWYSLYWRRVHAFNLVSVAWTVGYWVGTRAIIDRVQHARG
jgi:hypothetical protein